MKNINNILLTFFFFILFISKIIANIVTAKTNSTLPEYINVFIFSAYSIYYPYSFSMVSTAFVSINFFFKLLSILSPFFPFDKILS